MAEHLDGPRDSDRSSANVKAVECVQLAGVVSRNSGKTFIPEDLIRADAEVERARTERLLQFTVSETALGPSELRAEAAAIEAALPYNCEHVVPQSSFGEDEPMRGDIHLFACEVGCNGFRGNFPYFDFPDTLAAVRDACGRLEDVGFEPAAGKGPVARATLYFCSATRE